MSTKCKKCHEEFKPNGGDTTVKYYAYCSTCLEELMSVKSRIGERVKNLIDDLHEIVSSSSASDRQINNVKPVIGREVGKRWVDIQELAEKLITEEIKQDDFWTEWRHQENVLKGRVLTIIESLGLSSGEKAIKDISYLYMDNFMNHVSGDILDYTLFKSNKV